MGRKRYIDRQIEQGVEDIAKEFLNIDTLKTRGSDDLDFYEVSVWSIKEALEMACYRGIGIIEELE